jgi:hypothetical protein
LPSGNVHDLVGKAVREVEQRLGGLQPVFEVGDQMGRKKISKEPPSEKKLSAL